MITKIAIENFKGIGERVEVELQAADAAIWPEQPARVPSCTHCTTPGRCFGVATWTRTGRSPVVS